MILYTMIVYYKILYIFMLTIYVNVLYYILTNLKPLFFFVSIINL
jgi:hypothetical protein